MLIPAFCIASVNWLTLFLVVDNVSIGGIGVEVGIGGIGVKVRVGIAVPVGETTITSGVTAGAQEIKIKAISKTVTMFLIFIDTFLCKGRANGLRYPRSGGRRNAVRLEKG
jgi:hypothetical protein